MIVMKETRPGSPDGINVKMYEEGKEYDLSATNGERSLADVFLKQGWAEEKKALKGSPRNKMMGSAPENK